MSAHRDDDEGVAQGAGRPDVDHEAGAGDRGGGERPDGHVKTHGAVPDRAGQPQAQHSPAERLVSLTREVQLRSAKCTFLQSAGQHHVICMMVVAQAQLSGQIAPCLLLKNTAVPAPQVTCKLSEACAALLPQY